MLVLQPLLDDFYRRRYENHAVNGWLLLLLLLLLLFSTLFLPSSFCNIL
jgi:hypothetical protein